MNKHDYKYSTGSTGEDECSLYSTINITQQVKAGYDEGLAKGFCIGIIIGGVLAVMTCITYILSRGFIL